MNDAGRVIILPKGEYVAATTYYPLDAVIYNGNTYVAIGETTGNLPTDETYWKIFVKGATLMQGATAEADGAAGYIPKPLIADKDKFFKGDGTWAETEKTSLDSVGDEWSPTKTYNVGDMFIAGNRLWKTKVQHSGVIPAEGDYVTKTSVAEEFGKINDSLTNLTDYSNAEVIIGEYEGTTLYRKTIEWDMSSFVSSTTFTLIKLTHNINGLRKVIKHSCSIYRNGTSFNYSLPYFTGEKLNTFMDTITGTNARFYNNEDWGSEYTLVLTLEYTK